MVPLAERARGHELLAVRDAEAGRDREACARRVGQGAEAMSKRAIDVDKAIAQVRAIPSLAPVAAWAELGRAVAAAIRAAGGLPRVRKARVRKARVKVEGKA